MGPPEEELATAGEIAYLCKRMASKRLGISAARTKAGLAASDTLERLTKHEFIRLKEVLA